jgi:hypothetical protein
MLVLVGAVAGAIWGAWLARMRKGSRMDMAQYAGGFGIAFAVLGLFATLLLDRMIS